MLRSLTVLRFSPFSSSRLSFQSSTRLFTTTTTMPSNDGAPGTATQPCRVLIIGGSYAGLSTALTLVDLSRGQIPRFSYDREIAPPAHRIPVQITVVDERDGYCKDCSHGPPSNVIISN